jgi:hypothetical protein
MIPPLFRAGIRNRIRFGIRIRIRNRVESGGLSLSYHG